MGNSCCSMKEPCPRPCPCPRDMAKVVDPEGQLKLVRLPTTVAELMADHPGFAPALVDDIRETHSLLPMKMDQTLARQRLYLLVPIEKLQCF